MKVRFLVLAAAFLFTFSGCFQYATLVELNADGSGKLFLRVLFSKDLMKNSGSSFLSVSDDDSKSKVEQMLERAQKQFMTLTKDLGDGVEFVETKRINSKKGWVGLQATYSFADINKLRLPNTLPDFGEPDEDDDEDERPSGLQSRRGPYRFRYIRGAVNRLEARIEPSDADATEEDDTDPFAQAGLEVGQAPSVKVDLSNALAVPILKSMVQQARISTMVKVEGVVTETTAAASANESSVFLTDFDMGEFSKSELFDRSILEHWNYERLVEENVPGLKTHKIEETVTIRFKPESAGSSEQTRP